MGKHNNSQGKPANSNRSNGSKPDNGKPRNSGGYHATYGTDCRTDKPLNDPKWYNTNSEQVRAACKVNFYWPTGERVDVSTPYGATRQSYKSFPGICKVNLLLGPGCTTRPNSAVNYASRTMYMDVRHANSGSTNYDPVDMMMYSIAYANIYAFHAWLLRLNECLTHYTQTNKYLPRALITTMGADPDDLTRNAALFQGYVDTFADRAQRLYMPNVLPIFQRQGFVFRYVYHDAPSSKSQIYYFNPEGFYYVDETTSPAELKLATLSANASYAVIEAFGNNLLETLFNSQDAGVISGDMLKAYGDEKRIVFEHTEALPKLDLKYDPEVLMQIQNASLMGTPVAASLPIQQNALTGDIIYNPQFTLREAVNAGDARILNIHTSEAPTSDDIMVATRLMAIATVFGTSTTASDLICGTEIATTMTLYRFDYTGASPALISITTDQTCDVSLGTTTALTTIAERCITPAWLSYWDWAPMVQLIVRNGSVTPATIMAQDYMYDVDVYGIVDDVNLERLHAAALMSEFGAPYNA